jgi:hypothetical protein
LKFIACLLGLLTTIFCSASLAKDHAKLIHYGWDNPTISTLPDALKKLAASPFDGLSVAVPGLDQIFTTKLNRDTESTAALAKIPRGALSNSYIVVHAAADELFDWTDNTHWVAAMGNMRLLTKLAQAGGFKGLVFDMEPYGKSPWDYQTQATQERLNFAEYQTLVEQRGREMMAAMQQDYPGLDVWCLYGLSAFTDAIDEPDFKLAEHGYGLWPAFFGGWIKAAAPTTRIIDGNEPSYYYTDAREFASNRLSIANKLANLLPAQDRAAYVEKIHVGHAVFVDAIMNLAGSPRFIGYYFKSDAMRRALLQQNISAAMRSSDTLVWIYAENMKWWQATARTDIDKAIRRAKFAEIPSINLMINSAAERWKARISIGGKMMDATGKAVKPDGFKPALAALACSSWGDRGEYGCDFPKDSSVVIEPIFHDRQVNPAKITLKNLQKSNWGLNWVVK